MIIVGQESLTIPPFRDSFARIREDGCHRYDNRPRFAWLSIVTGPDTVDSALVRGPLLPLCKERRVIIFALVTVGVRMLQLRIAGEQPSIEPEVFDVGGIFRTQLFICRKPPILIL